MPKRTYRRTQPGHLIRSGPGITDPSKGMFTIDGEGPYSWHALNDELELESAEEAQLLAMKPGEVVELTGDDEEFRIVRLTFDRGEDAFKAYPTIGYPKFLGRGWSDESWGNDAAARASYPLTSKENEGPVLALWVDHDDPRAREVGGSKYALNLEPQGYASGDETETLIESDDPNAVAAKIEEFLKSYK